MKQLLKLAHFQMLVLLSVMAVVKLLLLAVDAVFMPRHDEIFALFISLIFIVLTYFAAKQCLNDKTKRNYFPAILPLLSGGVMTLFLLTTPMSFSSRFMLFGTLGLCSIIVFFVCAKRLQKGNDIIGTIYILAAFSVAFVIFYGTLFSSVLNKITYEALPSPDGRYIAEFGDSGFFDSSPYVSIRSRRTNIGIGFIERRPQRIDTITGWRNVPIYSAEWISNDVLRVVYNTSYGRESQIGMQVWYIRRESGRWRGYFSHNIYS